MPGKHRFTIKAHPIKSSALQKKPVVAPFHVKWPDACQLHQVMSHHEHNQNQHPVRVNAITPVPIGNNTRLFALSVTAINVASVTILGWCLFEKILSGTLFIGLEIILLLSAGFTLWWSAGVTGHSLEQEGAEDLYDEDDFIIH